MKKFISKVKKVIVAVVLAIISFPNKIFATIDPVINPSALDPALYIPETLYGVARQPYKVKIIWIIARTFIIPIVLLIGLIIYFKKSKSSKKKKILVTIGIIAVTAILYFVFDRIIIM